MSIRGETLISMWIPKGVTLLRGRCLFEAWRLLEETQFSIHCTFSETVYRLIIDKFPAPGMVFCSRC